MTYGPENAFTHSTTAHITTKNSKRKYFQVDTSHHCHIQLQEEAAIRHFDRDLRRYSDAPTDHRQIH